VSCFARKGLDIEKDFKSSNALNVLVIKGPPKMSTCELTFPNGTAIGNGVE
jgi:hypothetical protein